VTEKQAEAEIRYRLAKFLLFRLQEDGILTPEEFRKVGQTLCKNTNLLHTLWRWMRHG